MLERAPQGLAGLAGMRGRADLAPVGDGKGGGGEFHEEVLSQMKAQLLAYSDLRGRALYLGGEGVNAHAGRTSHPARIR